MAPSSLDGWSQMTGEFTSEAHHLVKLVSYLEILQQISIKKKLMKF